MSLLLKALQNAARNREAAGNVRAESGSDAGERREPPTELSLEPVHPSPRAAARNHAAFAEEPAERQPQPGPQHAQTILRAGARPEPIRHREPGFFDWIAQRPLVAFSTAAGLFAIGYGIYLYLQITNPALFIARPTATPPPPPPPPAVASAARTPQPPPPRVGESPTRSAPGTTAASPGSARAPSAAPSPRTDATAAAPPSSRQAAPGGGGVAATPAPGASSSAASSRSSSGTSAPSTSASGATSSSDVPARDSARADSTLARPGSGRTARERESSPARRSAAAAPAGSISDAPAAASPGDENVALAPESSRAGAPRVPARSRPAAPRQPAGTPAEPEGVSQAGSAHVVAVNSNVADAYQALEQGRLNDAERLYRLALASDGRNLDAMLGLASALSQQGQGAAASQLYLRALEQDPQNTYAQAGLLNVAGQADPAAAEARLKQLISRNPSAFLYFSLGNLYAGQGEWAAAQNAYFQAHKLAPDNPDYAFNLAVGLEHVSQPRIALDYYRRAVSLAQARGHAQFELARVENRIRSLEAVLKGQP